MRKIFTPILFFLLVLPLLFSSCDKAGDLADTTTGDETTVMENKLKIVEDGRAVFLWFIPTSRGRLFGRVRDGRCDKEATGATLELKSDFISWSTVRDPGL